MAVSPAIDTTYPFELTVVDTHSSNLWILRNSRLAFSMRLADCIVKYFQAIIHQWKSQGLKESEAGLSRRLLKRIQVQHQRPFVGGSFLTPVARRYIVLDDSKYSADRCCIFLSFPYFAVTEPQAENPIAKGESKHPMRTLLQSHYRLNKTVERDKDQCIKLLRGKNLKSCIEAPDMETAHLNSRETKERIYVPQLWGLIIGLSKSFPSDLIFDEAK